MNPAGCQTALHRVVCCFLIPQHGQHFLPHHIECAYVYRVWEFVVRYIPHSVASSSGSSNKAVCPREALWGRLLVVQGGATVIALTTVDVRYNTLYRLSHELEAHALVR
jgi:hypothetical protein